MDLYIYSTIRVNGLLHHQLSTVTALPLLHVNVGNRFFPRTLNTLITATMWSFKALRPSNCSLNIILMV
jgi:hypothetical protein